MRVLIIDDEEDIRHIARLSLSRVGGMEVIEAGSGPEGLRLAAETLPDAILLDVMMPEMDGPSTLAALRSDPALAAIPVVFLSAKAMPSELERLVQLGARGALAKPFDPMKLPAQFKAVLGG